MPRNVAGWDRAIRVAAVAALFALAPLVTRRPFWLLTAGLCGGLLLETAISGH